MNKMEATMECCQNVFGCGRVKGRVEENVQGEEEGNERRHVGHIGKRWWYLTMTYDLLFEAITSHQILC